MKQSILISLLLMAGTLAATRYYVSPEANGQAGSSWSDAISMQAALDRCTSGDEIWMLAGTYHCGEDADRTQSFAIPSGVAVYGGFRGQETNLTQRIPGSATILSGDLGRNGLADDNAFTVVSLIDASDATLLDNLTISGGQAMALSQDRTKTSAGGGLFIASESSISRPRIQNCTFTNNNARYGGAVYVKGTIRTAEPAFYNCQFINNEASFRGGAIYNDGENGRANPLITACYFEGNHADSGAGITNNGKAGESNPLIIESQFVANVSMVTGAAIYNQQGQGGEATPVIRECSYRDNESELNEDIANSERVTMASSRRHNGGGSLRPQGTRLVPTDSNR